MAHEIDEAQMAADFARIPDPVDGPMRRARALVEDHIATYGMVPHPDRIKEAIAVELGLAEIRAIDRGRSGRTQQLVARIKRTSKYYGQTKPGAWFDVRAVNDRSYSLRGNDNNYRLSDVALGVRLDDGSVVDLGNGKRG